MKWLTYLLFLCCFSVTANSQIYVNDSIPIRLSAIEARTVGDNARLDWKVVCLLPYARFEIQRSLNGVNFTTINSFEADRARCRQPFDFTDANTTGTSFYRIRVGDLDGRFFHSKIVAVTGKEKSFEINSVTPSLATSKTLLSISSVKNNIHSEVVITNFKGTIVKRFSMILNKGVTEFTVDLTGMSKGNYILHVSDGVAEIKTTRFVKL